MKKKTLVLWCTNCTVQQKCIGFEEGNKLVQLYANCFGDEFANIKKILIIIYKWTAIIIYKFAFHLLQFFFEFRRQPLLVALSFQPQKAFFFHSKRYNWKFSTIFSSFFLFRKKKQKRWEKNFFVFEPNKLSSFNKPDVI